LGRVDTLYVTNGASLETVLAAYEYYPTGSVKSIKMGNTITLDYEYHISGAVKSAVAYVLDNATSGSNGGSSGGVLNESTTAASSVPKVLYSETLYYEDCDSEGCTPQYNGNISRMVHHLAHINQFFSTERDVAYYYDELNRLTKVEDEDERDFYDEAFTYDPQGRIVRQARAEIAHEANGGASYVYIPNTNKLLTVSSNGGGKLNDRFIGNSYEIFRYDRDGNMIEDKSKKMTISYDHRGLPVEFKREVLSNENGADSVRLILRYDGAGSRISKIRERKSAGETEWATELATHYTGIGSEIREDAINNATKVVVNLPQGLGRYDIASASEPSANTVPSFEWYLKNHLGSTMLVYGTQSSTDPTIANHGSLKAAYDYRAFGEQVDLTHTTDKVTETFTGKELDDETDLSYFGARYLDQMLGMWVSVDAKRQFNSPYLYAGNGTNPVRFFDPNGLAMYQMAVFIDGLSNDDIEDINRVSSTLSQLDGFDFEMKFVHSQKELTEFVNNGTYTAVLTHGFENKQVFSKVNSENTAIEYSIFDNQIESGSFAKIFSCFSARNSDNLLNNITLEKSGKYKYPVEIGDAAKDAGSYLLNTYKEDLQSQE
jgi:RHS repeat-associated protein